MSNVKFILLGIVSGFLAQIIGFVLFWFGYTRISNYNWDLSYFVTEILSRKEQIGIFGILGAMFLFYYLNRKEHDFLARGVLISIIISVLVIVFRITLLK